MRRRTKVMLGGALALMALGGVAVLALDMQEKAEDPALVVREYLEAISDGDASRANQMAEFVMEDGRRLDELGESEPVLLTDEVLGSAVERIEVRSVETLEREDDSATVRAEVGLAGETYTHDFVLEGEPGGLFSVDHWTIPAPFIGYAVIEVETEMRGVANGREVEVGGRGITVEPLGMLERSSVAVGLFYPAVYEAAIDGGEYFVSAEGQLRVQPITSENRQRTLDHQIGFLSGLIDDPDLLLPFPFRQSFTEAVVKSGLEQASACAQSPDSHLEMERGTVDCPPLTNSAVVDGCLAEPNVQRVQGYVCAYYREVVPFRGDISVEQVSAEVELGIDLSEQTIESIGSYRFTETDTGRSFVASLWYADLEWVDGKPVVSEGGFLEDE